ncbi:MAG: hypothetical protein GF350_07710 [Chitinivibrionales bacterium]|nr:hypothetical protein [Chitinivibrionales bacterium]
MNLHMCRLFLISCLCIPLSAENIIYPPNSGIIDVTLPPWNVDNSGNSDVTGRLQEILDTYADQNRILYFPNGTYLVSGTIRYGGGCKRTVLQGQSTEGAMIRLAPNSPGFDDKRHLTGVIWTGEEPAQRFRNSIRNLTVSVGPGNPGASGIQYISNNQGHIFNVKIVSEDGGASVGLDMYYAEEIGPCLIRDLHVVGFDYGIMTAHPMNSITLENITLENQNKVGLYNLHQVLAVRNLKSTNRVTAVYNVNPAVTTIIDAELVNTISDTAVPAIQNNSMMFARNITTSGYDLAVKNVFDTTRNRKDAYVQEFVSHDPYSLFASSSAHSLDLPVEESPELPWPTPSEWESPLEHGGRGDGSTDDTRAVQDAIDAGRSTVYFSGGKNFRIGGTVYIRGNVSRLIGCEGRLSGNGTFVLGNEGPDTVIVQGFDCGGSGVSVKHQSRRTLVIRGVVGMQYRSPGNVGPLFLDDYCVDDLSFKNQTVYARQLNCESSETKIVNENGQLWILGYKTERPGVLCNTRYGGSTEILGSFTYATGDAKTMAMFVDNESDFSLAGHGGMSTSINPWKTLVAERRDGISKTFVSDSALPREYDSAIPLFIGFESDQRQPVFIRTIPDTTVVAGDTLNTALAAQAPDPDEMLTYSLVKGPAGMTVIDGHILHWPVPAQGQGGLTVVRVEDRTGLAAQDTFMLNINHRPEFLSPRPPDTIVHPGETFHWNVDAEDPDGQPVAFFLDSIAGTMIIQKTTGMITYNASVSDTGVYRIVIRATDSSKASAYQRFSMTVSANGTVGIAGGTSRILPDDFSMSVHVDRYFSSRMTVRFAVPAKQPGGTETSAASGYVVQICIFDIKGRLVARLVDGYIEPGYYERSVSAGNSPGVRAGNGMYVVSMNSGSFWAQKKIVCSW